MDGPLFFETPRRKAIIHTLVSLLILGLACQSESELSSSEVDLQNIPDHESWNATITTTQSGKLSSKITYTYMRKFSSKRLTEFEDGIEIDLFEDGKHVSHIVADQARMNENTHDVLLNGRVKVKSDDGLLLFTEMLTWNEENERVVSDASVTVINAENDTIYGTGFESDKGFVNWLITNPYGVTQKKLNLPTAPDDEK